MVNAPPLAQMRAQFDSLIDAGWGTPATVTRLSGTVDGAGHVSGSFASIATGEKIWIQALAGRSSVDTKNLNSETSHLAFQKFTGVALRAKDRILPSGSTYVYDVIATEVLETHRMSQLKQDIRS